MILDYTRQVAPDIPIRKDIMNFLLEEPPVKLVRGNYTKERPFRNPNKRAHEAVLQFTTSVSLNPKP